MIALLQFYSAVSALQQNHYKIFFFCKNSMAKFGVIKLLTILQAFYVITSEIVSV